MLCHLLFSTLRSDPYSLSCCDILPTVGQFNQWHNKYWSDRKVENSSWKSMQNCILYIYIKLWYDQNSNAQLEPKFWVRENEAPLYVEPGKETACLYPVRVTTQPKQTGSGFWTGLELN